MTICDEFREKFPLALFDEVEGKEKDALDFHLGRCGACAAEYASFEATVAVAGQSGSPKPVPGVLDNLWDELEPRLDAIDDTGAGKQFVIRLGWNRFWKGLSFRPAWAVPAAAVAVAAAIVVVSQIAPRTEVVSRTPLAAENPNVQRVRAFFGDAERLIMGISNLDPSYAEEASFDFSAERKAALELAIEAASLRVELIRSGDRKLLAVVTDLERIFLQISNIDEDRSRADIELVQSALEQKAILFEMSLEEFRRTAVSKASV